MNLNVWQRPMQPGDRRCEQWKQGFTARKNFDRAVTICRRVQDEYQAGSKPSEIRTTTQGTKVRYRR
jgi:hypothetical protein